MIHLLSIALLLAPAQQPDLRAATRVLVLEAQHDATLIENALGGLANGSGPHFFVGRTNQPADARRRTLLRFDVAGALPPNALIEDATLVLHLSQGSGPPVMTRLYRASRPWTEGPSAASGGQGAPTLVGDVTWIHGSYPGSPWTRPGGDFIPASPAVTQVDGPGFYAWSHPQRTAQDVRLWLHNPRQNHGWLLVGDEGLPGSTRRFDSREHPDPARRPALEIRYRLPGPPP